MSYLSDKVPCKICGDLYDPDQLDKDECLDCYNTATELHWLEMAKNYKPLEDDQ